MRSLIKKHIITAWETCVFHDYNNQRINSERSLQAAFWSHIYKDLPDNMRLFIEPTLTINGNDKIRPDIVVCNNKSVISIIEIKYLPRGKPKYDKDIKNLALIAEQREAISITNHRFQGIEKDKTKYTLPKSVLYVWAGFHTKQNTENKQLFSQGYDILKGRYLQLQAETAMGVNPAILVNGKYK